MSIKIQFFFSEKQEMIIIGRRAEERSLSDEYESLAKA